MDTGSNFRLSDLMQVTALAAFLFCVLFTPSPGWCGPLIFGVMVAIAIAIQRAIISTANRPFWVSVLVGALAYFFLIGFLTSLFENDPLSVFVGEPWWQRRYGVSPYNESDFGAYATFLFALHIVFGGAAATMAARVAQFVCRGSKSE